MGKEKEDALEARKGGPLARLVSSFKEAEQRRQEVLEALRRGDVREPITTSIFTIAVLKSVLISAAFSVGA